MRKLLIILLLVPFLCQGQFDMITPAPVGSNSTIRGVWGFGSNAPAVITSSINTYGELGNGSNWKGYHSQIQWSDIETSDNVFDWTEFDAKVNAVKAQGLLVGVQLWVGPSSPAWLMTLAGSFTTTQSILNVCPRYYNPVYMTRYYRILRKFAERCAFLGGIVTWQVSEGTTGDAQPYHGSLTSGVGDPFVPQSDQDNDEWSAYKHVAWDSVNVDRALYGLDAAGTHLMFNTGNDAKNVDVVASGQFGDAWGKKADAASEYVFMGEGLYVLRPYILSRSEISDSVYANPHYSQNYYMHTVAASSANLQLDIFNTPLQYYTTYAGTDTRYGAFFNRYANDTIPETSRNAFIKLGLVISIDSTSYWTEGTYGVLINNTTAYNNAINNINANPVDSPSYKAVLRMRSTRAFTNPTRTANLISNTGTTALYNGTNNTVYSYNSDFSYSGTQNWSKFITEINPFANSFPLYRISPDTALYGRFAKRFTATNLMSFDISNNWNYGAASATVNFLIAYLDSGTDSWAVQVYNSSGVLTTIATQTNTNTGLWKQKTFSTTMFFRTGEDFRLIHTAGASNVIFDTIEINANPSS